MTDNKTSPKDKSVENRSVLNLALAVLLLAALTGAALSASLALMHYAGKEAGGPLAGACGPGGSCDKVLNSRWSLFPPGPAPSENSVEVETSALSGLVESEVALSSGFPVALLGLFYYSTVFLWFAVLGPRALAPGLSCRFFRFPLFLVFLSCIGSLAFIGIMKFAIGVWCPLCLASHACNFVILAVLARSFLRQRKTPRDDTQEAPASPRLVTAVILLISFALLAEWVGLHGIGLTSANSSLKAFATSAASLEMAYIDSPQHEMNIRDDDPMIPAAPGTRMTLVVFGDAQCPYCAAFDRFLNTEVLPIFRGHLRVVFKHFPIDLHEHAFEAATALEAARIQGAFDKAHHELFERSAELAEFDYRAFAEELDLDPDQFLEDMASPETRDRIREDQGTLIAALGEKTVIPALFLNGRFLDGRMRSVLGFWQSRADALHRSRTQYGLDWGDSEFDRFHGEEPGKAENDESKRAPRLAPTPAVAPTVAPNAWTLQPASANFGPLATSQDVRRIVVTIRRADSGPFPEIHDFQSSGPRFRASLLDRNDDLARVVVEAVPPFPRGISREVLRVTTDDGEILLPAVTSGPSPLVAEPRRIISPPPGNAGEATIMVRSPFGEAFSITDVSTNLEGVSFGKITKGNESARISLRFAPDFRFPPGLTVGLVRISTEHEEVPLLQVPVFPGGNPQK